MSFKSPKAWKCSKPLSSATLTKSIECKVLPCCLSHKHTLNENNDLNLSKRTCPTSRIPGTPLLAPLKNPQGFSCYIFDINKILSSCFFGMILLVSISNMILWATWVGVRIKSWNTICSLVHQTLYMNRRGST